MAKNGTQVTLNLSSNVDGKFNDETNFPHEFLLIERQVSRFCKAFANDYQYKATENSTI